MIKLERHGSGFIMPLHVSAGAGADAVRGEYNGRLKVAVTAPPEAGKANRAICKLIAARLGTAAGNVRMVSGHKSREKKVLIENVTEQGLAELLRL